METKKVVKKNSSKSTKKKIVKEIPKKTTKKKKKTKGFTLIELLAVIIILGVLLIIAIPSVTTYISNSRKSAYIDTAKNVIGAARNLVNSGKYDMYDVGITYYVPVSCINTESGLHSPYGDFTEAYVIVTYNGDGYEYYWTSTDSSQMGIKELVAFNDLNEDDIEPNVKNEDIKKDVGVDGRSRVAILASSCDNFSYGSASSDNLYDQIVILSNDPTNDDVIVDEFGNIRYVGSNPDNYVLFNGEEWRIVGIVDGNVKIIRTNSLGTMNWLNVTDTGNLNNWPTSNIKELLNGSFYNNLSTKAKELIDNHVWKLGGIDRRSVNNSWLPINMYNQERGTAVYSGNATEWTGNVGLIYPSDYGLATRGGSTTSREECLNTHFVDWRNPEVSDCKDNVWLYDGNNNWTITSSIENQKNNFLFADYGQVGVNANNNGHDYTMAHNVRPSVYLKKSAKIISGDGSKTNPFQFE